MASVQDHGRQQGRAREAGEGHRSGDAQPVGRGLQLSPARAAAGDHDPPDVAVLPAQARHRVEEAVYALLVDQASGEPDERPVPGELGAGRAHLGGSGPPLRQVHAVGDHLDPVGEQSEQRRDLAAHVLRADQDTGSSCPSHHSTE
jgi:hypothetical protein